jgi:hypothetical protein
MQVLYSRRVDSRKTGVNVSGAHCVQYVIPYRIGGYPFGVDVFGSAMQLFDQIAARVLGPGRSDASPANANGGKMACGRKYGSSASEDYSPSRDQNIQRLRAFPSATHPLTETQVRSISSSWTIVPHRWAEWRHCKKCRLAAMMILTLGVT